jgi:hypothetical protein
MGVTPSVASVAPRTSTPDVQQPLALRVEVEKSKNVAARRCVQRPIAADELVVHHAAVSQRHGSPRLDPCPRAERKARSEHQRIEQIAFESHMTRHGAIVVRTRQWRDEVDVTGGSAFQKAAAWNFDDYIDLRRQICVLENRATAIVEFVHTPSVLQSKQARALAPHPGLVMPTPSRPLRDPAAARPTLSAIRETRS